LLKDWTPFFTSVTTFYDFVIIDGLEEATFLNAFLRGNVLASEVGPKPKTPTRPAPELPVEIISPTYYFNIADFTQTNLSS
jgi:hypothetical protein